MRSFKLREAFLKIMFRLQNIKYLSRKHYYLTVFLFNLILLVIFTMVFINQRREMERKDNMIRSFYTEEDPAMYTDQEGRGESGKEN